MVRRNLRLWLGAGAFAVLVAALALIGLSRIPEASLDGRWSLILIETPEASFGPVSGNEWIEFDGLTFRGEMPCFQFDGELMVTRSGRLELGGWGWAGGCEELDPVSQAFDEYFGSISEFDIGPGGLTLKSAGASAQFRYRLADS